MAEGLTDDELVTIVDSYKRKRLTNCISSSHTSDDRDNRCACMCDRLL